jgi:1,2-phenylacetyl-CoA epoxidase catalytic subunit
VPGGRQGVHTEDFAELWAEMTALYRSDPEARW